RVGTANARHRRPFQRTAYASRKLMLPSLPISPTAQTSFADDAVTEYSSPTFGLRTKVSIVHLEPSQRRAAGKPSRVTPTAQPELSDVMTTSSRDRTLRGVVSRVQPA